VDRCHQGKEEEFLFPSFESIGVPHEQGPVGVLLHEQEQGRRLIAQILMMRHGSRSGWE